MEFRVVQCKLFLLKLLVHHNRATGFQLFGNNWTWHNLILLNQNGNTGIQCMINIKLRPKPLNTPQRKPAQFTVQDLLNPDIKTDSDLKLLRDLHYRVTKATQNTNKQIDDRTRLLLVLNAIIYGRWELQYYQNNWPATDMKGQQQLQRSLQVVDALLVKLVDLMYKIWPECLTTFILPEGVPVDQSIEALGPVYDRIRIQAALGRTKPLPKV